MRQSEQQRREHNKQKPVGFELNMGAQSKPGVRSVGHKDSLDQADQDHCHAMDQNPATYSTSIHIMRLFHVVLCGQSCKLF